MVKKKDGKSLLSQKITRKSERNLTKRAELLVLVIFLKFEKLTKLGASFT